MRLLILIIFIISACGLKSQKLTVKLTQYGPEGRIVSETIKTSDRPANAADLNFFQKQFHMPRELPDKLGDPDNKNKIIIKWHNEKQEKTLTGNWNNTFTYDSLARLIAFTYSGCLMCSSTAYKFTISYNKNGQIESLKNMINGNEEYKIMYNDKGGIIQIDHLKNEKLSESLLTDL
jgi:hypothetical protein